MVGLSEPVLRELIFRSSQILQSFVVPVTVCVHRRRCTAERTASCVVRCALSVNSRILGHKQLTPYRQVLRRLA